MITSHSFLLPTKNVSDKGAEKIKTHIFILKNVFLYRSIYAIMCKNIVEREKPTDDNMAQAYCLLYT